MYSNVNKGSYFPTKAFSLHLRDKCLNFHTIPNQFYFMQTLPCWTQNRFDVFPWC